MVDIKEFLEENPIEELPATDYDSIINLLDENEIAYDEYSFHDPMQLYAIDKVVVRDVDGDECLSFYFVADRLVQVEDDTKW